MSYQICENDLNTGLKGNTTENKGKYVQNH